MHAGMLVCVCARGGGGACLSAHTHASACIKTGRTYGPVFLHPMQKRKTKTGGGVRVRPSGWARLLDQIHRPRVPVEVDQSAGMSRELHA